MTLPVRIAFNEEKSAILIKPPAETYLRVRARNQPGVTSFGPISCDDTVREYRAKASACAREVTTLTTSDLNTRRIGKEGKRERERFSLLWLQPRSQGFSLKKWVGPHPFFKGKALGTRLLWLATFSSLGGYRELTSSSLSEG